MNDIEWLAYLDTLPPELSDLATNIAERINTLLNRERNAAISERQALERQVTDLRTRTKDLLDRIAELEQLRTKAVGDASDDA